MAKNIVAFFGVNGVGKTTIAHAISALSSEVRYISGSGLLMKAFGDVTRETLERISHSEKMRIMEPTFQAAFEICSGARFAVLDSHLVVPIRRDGTVLLENIWSQNYTPYIERAYMIIAPPKEILERRVKDAEQDGRKRDIDISHIERDQETNIRIFEEVVQPICYSQVIHNGSNDLCEAVTAIKKELFAVFGS
ncbi:MAG: AAA family ATPase [bacterium]|nr:AAA family ATPase [bacterium]